MGRKVTHPLVLAAMALLALAPAAGGARPKCATKKGYVLVTRSPRLALFTSTGDYFDTRVCSYRTGKRHWVPEDPLLYSDNGRRLQNTAAARGRYAAFIWEASEGPDDFYDGIGLVDESGQYATITISKSLSRRHRRFVLKASGAIAWSEKTKLGPRGVDDPTTTNRPIPRVFACLRRCLKYDAIPPRVQLASGRDINLNSLRGIRGGVEWRQGNRWRRARLPTTD
jgi:hypothetical protein